jgi:flagellar biosynthesis regulator FlaF
MSPRLTAPQLVWIAHGEPSVEACSAGDGLCLVCCGPLSRGQAVHEWLKSSFTDQNRTRNPLATHVCEACCYVMSRTSPVLGRPPKEGKKFGGNFRNYSHLYESGWDSPSFGDDLSRSNGYVNASKGEKPAIREFLRREHVGMWFAGIADSGQKHVLPFTPLNAPGRGGVVLFEEQLVHVHDSLELVDAMMSLLTAGATKEELDRGDYRAQTWMRCEADVRSFEAAHAKERQSAWWSLALWLAQRDEEAVAARMAAEKAAKKKAAKPRKEKRSDRRTNKGAPPEPDGGDTAGTAERLPEDGAGQRDEALGDPAKQSTGSSKKLGKRRRVADEATARIADTEPGTLRLPGFD